MRGTPTAFQKLTTKDADTLYFISETDSDAIDLYIGERLVSSGVNNISEIKLDDLTDVLIDLDLEDASFLVYDAELQEWVNKSRDELAFTGATSMSSGVAGLVPAPETNEIGYFLRGDGTWAPISGGDTTAVNSNIYQATVESDETHLDAIARVVGETALNKSDIAIVKELIVDDKYSHTAYIYTGDAWAAMDGNYSAENVYFAGDMLVTTDIGYIKTTNGSGTIPSAGKNLTEVFEAMFVQEKEPTITQPSLAIGASSSTTIEAGTVIAPYYNVTFNAGKYSYGPETGVTLVTNDNTTTGFVVSDSLGNTTTASTGGLPAVEFTDGMTYTFTATVEHTAGAVPVTNKGNERPDKAITAKTITKSSSPYTVVRHAFWEVKSEGETIDVSTVNSAVVRAFDNVCKTSSTLPKTITANKMQQIFIAIPQSMNKTVASILDKANIPQNISHTVISVEGANGYQAVDYDLYYVSNATAASGDNTYTVSYN